MTYYVSLLPTLVNPAQIALIATYGDRVTQSVVRETTDVIYYSTIQIDTDDPTITADDISATITNATGQYATVGTSNPGTGPNMGAFLNSVGDAIRKALTQFKICDFLKSSFGVDVCTYWWLPFAFVLVLGIVIVFFLQASKGFGEGIAARA